MTLPIAILALLDPAAPLRGSYAAPMDPAVWLPAHALQAGGLLTLAAFFLGDRWSRRDRFFTYAAAVAALTGLRHVAGMGEAMGLLDPVFARRIITGLAAIILAVLIQAVAQVVPGLSRRGQVIAMALLAPGFLRCLLLPMDAPWSLLIHDAGLVVFLGCLAWMGRAMLQGAREGDAASRHMLAALLLSLVPIAVEIAVVASGQRFPISGLFGLILAVALGHTRHAMVTRKLREEAVSAQRESAAWRGLMPGLSWRSAEGSPMMDTLFGPDWRGALRDRMLGLDGVTYDVRWTRLGEGAEVGLVQPRGDAAPEGAGFLTGWTVALAVDPRPQAAPMAEWLRDWGAQVETWNGEPPRQGPYPAFILWGGDPATLAAWRREDPARRKTRWVQVGGPEVAGPHQRIEATAGPEALREALQELLRPVEQDSGKVKLEE